MFSARKILPVPPLIQIELEVSIPLFIVHCVYDERDLILFFVFCLTYYYFFIMGLSKKMYPKRDKYD